MAAHGRLRPGIDASFVSPFFEIVIRRLTHRRRLLSRAFTASPSASAGRGPLVFDEIVLLIRILIIVVQEPRTFEIANIGVSRCAHATILLAPHQAIPFCKRRNAVDQAAVVGIGVLAAFYSRYSPSLRRLGGIARRIGSAKSASHLRCLRGTSQRLPPFQACGYATASARAAIHPRAFVFG